MASQTRSPTAAVSDNSNGGTQAWANPTNSFASDNVRSTATRLSSLNPLTHRHWSSDFDFAVPSGATIDGIEARVERQNLRPGAVPCTDDEVSLVIGGTVQGTNKAAAGDWLQEADEVITYGGPTDKWGLTPDDADLNAIDFGVVVAAVRVAGGADPALDHIEITVHYTEGGGGDEHSGSATVAGGGTATGSGTKAAAGSALAAGGGAASGSGTKQSGSSVSLAGGGDAASSGFKAALSEVVVAGGGDVTASGTRGGDVESHSGSGLVAGGGSVNASGFKALHRPVSIAGGGAISSSGRKSIQRAVVCAGGGSALVSGQKHASGFALVAGGGEVLAIGVDVTGAGTPVRGPTRVTVGAPNRVSVARGNTVELGG